MKNIYYTLDDTTPNDSKTLYTGAAITVNKDMTIKAIAYDNAGNASGILEATYGIAPKISLEASSSVTSTTATVTWTTDDFSTSRVIYDTVSHPGVANPTFDDPFDKYGYANTTDEFDTLTKVTSHSVGLTGLTAGTTYYYRTVSHGSPETVSDEHNIGTTSFVSTTNGGGGGTASAPTCNDIKPGSAPILLSVIAGVNSVTLSWSKAASPVSYYLVAYGNTSGVYSFGNPNVGDSNTTSYTVTGLSGNTTYYFKVRAGNGCMPGDYSNELSSTPTGGFIAGVPAGFEEGVLGTTTAEEEQTTEEGQVLGGAGATQAEIQKNNNFGQTLISQVSRLGKIRIIGIIILLIGLAFLIFSLFRKKRQ